MLLVGSSVRTVGCAKSTLHVDRIVSGLRRGQAVFAFSPHCLSQTRFSVGELLAAGASLCDTLSRALSRSSPRVAGHSTAHALDSPMAACGLPRVAAVLHAAAPALSRPLPPPSANTVAPGLPGVPLAVASERRTGTADGSADKCVACRQPARGTSRATSRRRHRTHCPRLRRPCASCIADRLSCV